MTSLVIDVSGIPVLDRTLARFAQRAVLESDLTDITDALAHDLAANNTQTFDTEGHGRWAPLSPNYRAWKEKHYPGRPILVRTGALRDSLTRTPLGVQTHMRGRITLGTDIPYAAFHQSGGPHLPRRPPVDLNERTKRELLRTLQRWIVTGTAH